MGFTDEQQDAIDWVREGNNLSLIAPAGSGKSHTAGGMARALKGKKILYLVYNTQARKDAERKFADMTWMDVRTRAQIGWRAYADRSLGHVGQLYAERMKPGAEHVPAKVVANKMGLKPIDFGGGLILDGFTQARLAEEAIQKFCYSDHTRITARNVVMNVAGVDRIILEAAREHIASLAWTIWKRAIQPDSKLRFSMDHAFKLVAESGKDFGYEVVIVDEAQDSNNAAMKFVRNQKSAQIILTGDPAQTLYSWMGASDQMLKFDAQKKYLTRSFRFGPAVAEEAMKHLVHTETGVKIVGHPGINDRVTEGEMVIPDVVLTRTNAGAMTYAMSYMAGGHKVALVKGTKEIVNLAYAARDLMAGRKPKDLQLSAFANWSELVDYTEEPGGGHLKSIVKLIQVYGVSDLIEACDNMVNYSAKYPKHDVAVTTCHSIKGMEWPKVQIGDDFFEPEPFENPLTQRFEPGTIERHEAMVQYVAVTRAERHLDRSGLSWIDNYPAPVERNVQIPEDLFDKDSGN